MARQLPPLAWLRAFEASARHLSFTHAAAELHLTQAAVSKQVKLLEFELREQLFERKPRSLLLTKIGAAYLPKVQDAFERLDVGTQEVFGARQGGTLTLRVPVGYAVNWLAPRLPRFFAACPDIPLRIVSSIWREDVDRDSYDLDIRYGLGQWPGFRADQLTRETVTPLCRADVAARLATPDDLARERLLHVMGYQEGWATWLAAAGAVGVNAGSGMHFDTSLMAFEVAAQGGGVALGRRSMACHERDLGRLVEPFDLRLPLQENFFLLTAEKGRLQPRAATFRDWLIAEARADGVPGGV